MPRDKLCDSIRKLLFHMELSAYNVEPLALEVHERHALKLLQSEMCVTQASLLALSRLGLRGVWGGGGSTSTAAMDPAMALELIDGLVQRAVPVACKPASAPAVAGVIVLQCV